MVCLGKKTKKLNITRYILRFCFIAFELFGFFDLEYIFRFLMIYKEIILKIKKMNINTIIMKVNIYYFIKSQVLLVINNIFLILYNFF